MEMDLDIGFLGDFEECSTIEEVYISSIKKLSESSLIPKDKVLLGLDISEGSTGYCIYDKGSKTTGNLSLSERKGDTFREVLLRRELKEKLYGVIRENEYDLIVIEDAFQGVNPSTTRLLYAINTAIDELIIDGLVCCNKFLRVSNKSWKSWLFSIDTEGLYKGLDDKLRIQKCLEMLGVYESGEGYQDRLDATGMILGYLMCKDEADKKLELSKKKKVSKSDIVVDFQEEIEFILEKLHRNMDEVFYKIVSESRWSKSKMLNYLTENPECVFISNLTYLGNLAKEFNLEPTSEQGYFGFWINPSKLKKYKED